MDEQEDKTPGKPADDVSSVDFVPDAALKALSSPPKDHNNPPSRADAFALAITAATSSRAIAANMKECVYGLKTEHTESQRVFALILEIALNCYRASASTKKRKEIIESIEPGIREEWVGDGDQKQKLLPEHFIKGWLVPEEIFPNHVSEIGKLTRFLTEKIAWDSEDDLIKTIQDKADVAGLNKHRRQVIKTNKRQIENPAWLNTVYAAQEAALAHPINEQATERITSLFAELDTLMDKPQKGVKKAKVKTNTK